MTDQFSEVIDNDCIHPLLNIAVLNREMLKIKTMSHRFNYLKVYRFPFKHLLDGY